MTTAGSPRTGLFYTAGHGAVPQRRMDLPKNFDTKIRQYLSNGRITCFILTLLRKTLFFRSEILGSFQFSVSLMKVICRGDKVNFRHFLLRGIFPRLRLMVWIRQFCTLF